MGKNRLRSESNESPTQMACEERIEKDGGTEMKTWFYNPEAVEPPEPDYYECPVCGTELSGGSTVYIRDGEIVGCEECIETRDAADYFEEEL